MYTISQMEHFSGVKSHTIRVWEQRYNALSPNRSTGNTRYYNSDQLRRLLNIVSLKEALGKIAVSKICQMPDDVLSKHIETQLVQKAEVSNGSHEYLISQLTAASMSFDEDYFERLFLKAESDMGLVDTYVHIIYPFLHRVGLLWNANSLSPAHEHFASSIVRQKLSAAIDKTPLNKNSKEVWLLFLPENEFHEIGLLFANYLVKSAGKKVIYLGGNVSLDLLQQTVEELNPTHLYFFMVHYNSIEICQSYFERIYSMSKSLKVLFSGNSKLIDKLHFYENMCWIKSVNDLQIKLK